MNEDILDDGVVNLGGDENIQALDPTTATTLIETAKWGKYYLILAAIGLVLQPIMQYFNMRKIQADLEGVNSEYLLGVQLSSQIFTYMLIIALFGYPIYRFYEFATKTPGAIEDQSHAGFVQGILGLKSTFKYLGILTFVIIGLYVMLIVIGLAVALIIGVNQ